MFKRFTIAYILSSMRTIENNNMCTLYQVQYLVYVQCIQLYTDTVYKINNILKILDNEYRRDGLLCIGLSLHDLIFTYSKF